MDLKVLLVEDEKGIRLLMRKVIEKQQGFEVVGECENILEGIAAFSKYKPDVVFLDIGLKDGSGLECARIIADINPKTKIIFATAHTEYMSEAFEVYAFDYLIKPFDIKRLEQTLERIKALQNLQTYEQVEQIVQTKQGLEKLILKGKESTSFINTADIILIQREDRNTVIYTKDKVIQTSISLGDLEEKLGNESFMRSHKSYIINLTCITQIEPYGRWTYIVKLEHLKIDALITQEKYEEVKQRYMPE